MLCANVLGNLLGRSGSRKGLAVHDTLSREQMGDAGRHATTDGGVDEVVGDASHHLVDDHQWGLGGQHFPEPIVGPLLLDSSGDGFHFG